MQKSWLDISAFKMHLESKRHTQWFLFQHEEDGVDQFNVFGKIIHLHLD